MVGNGADNEVFQSWERDVRKGTLERRGIKTDFILDGHCICWPVFRGLQKRMNGSRNDGGLSGFRVECVSVCVCFFFLRLAGEGDAKA